MLRRTLLASAGVMALSGVALAAEPLPPPPPPPPPFTWEGFYIGVTAGYDQATHTLSDLSGIQDFFEDSGSASFRTSGFIGGGTLGYNWQAGSFVYGLETDFSGLTNSNSFSSPFPTFFAAVPDFSDLGTTENFSNRISWLWTIRPRIGLAVDRTLVYFTAGFALAGVHNSLASTTACSLSVTATNACDGDEPIFNASRGNALPGYVVGGGVEYALTPNWTIKGEALYVNLSSRTSTFAVSEPDVFFETFTAGPFNARVDTSLVLVRAGLNYKFSWPVPVVAKY